MSINRVMLLGNVGNDPEIRITQDGRKFANFSLATSEKWKDKNSSEAREKTEWHKIAVYSQPLANVIEQYVKKGTKLFVEGSLQTKKYNDKNGIERGVTEIVLQGFNNKLEILSNGKQNGNEITENYADIDENIPY